jgi:hypothetical protein
MPAEIAEIVGKLSIQAADSADADPDEAEVWDRVREVGWRPVASAREALGDDD